jgi:ectoine hydroxylase-related dioxygenase (phytanoyl-CoA dioxygenase family)
MLTQEQTDFFMRYGYVACGKILTDEEVEVLRSEYDTEFAKARRSGGYRNLSANGAEEPESATEMLQIMQMCERNLHFRRLLYDTRILDRVEALIGPNIMLFHDQALFKPAQTGGPVHWHQDNAYWRCAPANLVSCWLTLDDVDEQNGAMQIIPGSHLAPVGHERSETASALLQSKVDNVAAEVIVLPAGGVMLHHCQTLHYTAPNTTDRQRRAFAIHFMTPGTRSHGEPMRVGFERPMLRMRM